LLPVQSNIRSDGVGAYGNGLTFKSAVHHCAIGQQNRLPAALKTAKLIYKL